jgi:hypothetical protein
VGLILEIDPDADEDDESGARLELIEIIDPW